MSAAVQTPNRTKLTFRKPLNLVHSASVGAGDRYRLFADGTTINYDRHMTRAEFIKTATADITADVHMYATKDGGREGPAYPGWGCPCMVSQMQPLIGYDALPLLGNEPLSPGQRRHLGFVFLSHEEAVPIMRTAGRFYLWEGRFIGEAVVLND